MSKLEELRAKLKAKLGGASYGDPAEYRFFKLPEKGSATKRFLPDGNTENSPFFWHETQSFRWKFPSAENPGEFVNVFIPCREMYDGPKSCPITNELRAMYATKDKEIEALASKWWPKKQYIYQGFVRSASHEIEQSPPENPIRIFKYNNEIHKIIFASIMTEEESQKFENFPVDFKNGTDFVVTRTVKGGYADWTTSGWARRESPLTDFELEAIEKYGLHDLKSKQPPRPSDEAYDLLNEIFEAGINGEPWNPDWNNFFRPFDSKSKSDNSNEEKESSSVSELKSKPSPKKEVEEAPKEEAPAEEVKVEETKASPADIMARLKEKAAATKASDDTPTEAPSTPVSSAPAASAKASTNDIIARLRAKKGT